MRILALLIVVLLGCGRLWGASAASTATLEQCREELQPTQPVELRRRATLVVGKYLDAEASELLTQCLQDEDAVVRRNALVSIGEEQFHLSRNRAGVLKCLRDEDANIRRLASSLLDEVLRGRHILANSVQPMELPEELVTASLNAALTDEDAEVRRNVLSVLQEVPYALDGAVLAPFLQETSSATVILAITPYLMSDATSAEQCAVLLPLAEHPEREIRLALAEALADRPHEAFVELYRKLAADALPEVRSHALGCLLRVLPEESAPWAEVQLLLNDDATPAESRINLLEALRGFSADRCWPLVMPLLSRSQPERLRFAAWQILLPRKDLQEKLPLERLVDEFLAEPSSDVRRLQLSMLRRKQDELTADDLEKLQSSTLGDVRKAVLSLSAKLPTEQRIEVVFNALLDEDETVRTEAVRLIASLRPPEWKQLLCDSLEESSPVISAAAARGLLPVARTDEKVAKALLEFLPRCQDASLRRQITERLHKNSTKHLGPQNEQ